MSSISAAMRFCRNTLGTRTLPALIAGAVLFAIAPGIAQSQAVVKSPLISRVPTAKYPCPNGPVYATARTADHIYVGGQFTSVGHVTGHTQVFEHFEKQPTDSQYGKPDVTFPNVNGNVYAAVSDGTGGWFIAGDFTHIWVHMTAIAAPGIARIVANGITDAQFATALAGRDTAILKDGATVNGVAYDKVKQVLYLAGDLNADNKALAIKLVYNDPLYRMALA